MRPAIELGRLRGVVDLSFEPSLLVRLAGPGEGGASGVGGAGAGDGGAGDDGAVGGPAAVGGLVVEAANAAAAALLDPSALASGPRALAELLPWARASGLLDALADAMESGAPLRIPVLRHPDGSEPQGPARPHSLSVAALRIEPGLLLVTLRPLRGTAATDPAWEERLHRLTGTGPWEWDLRSGIVYWYGQALTILGSTLTAGPLPVEAPPFAVHKDDAAEYEAFLAALPRAGRARHVEVRVLRLTGAVRHIRFGGDPVRDESGAVVCVYGSVQDVTDRRRIQTALEIAQVQLAARRSRADSERQLAGLLQQVIMPTGPAPDGLEGIDLATRYRPASSAAGVGGDWYGVARLANDRVLLHVGDVAGHGFPAATAMARLYHALHGLAVTGGGSGTLLHWLNKLTCELPEFTIASACCAVYDPPRRRLNLANAGHPSPVLVRGGRAATLPKPAGGMLGVDPEEEFEEQEHAIEPGDVLLLYTDGLIERRRRTPEENTAMLLEHAARTPDDLEAYADRILTHVRSDTDDDACLLAVRFD